MNGKTQHGYLVLADISGYTSYVAKTELEDSEEILTELLEVLVNHMITLLTLSKLEGDAVFGYVAESKVPRSETMLELVEATYGAFRDRALNMNRRTTCTCKACRSIPLLDLKFILHHGEYIKQSIAGIHELVGSDVNLIHRLTKNHVGEATGWRAYALFTEDVLEHLGIPLDGAHAQLERYEHLGEVKTFSFNLQERYQALSAARRVFLNEKDADVHFTVKIDAPPAIVWTWENDPQKRTQCALTDVHWRAGERPAGRTGVGARNHCAHGKGESTETILDWRPFDYFTTEAVDPSIKNATMLSTVQLVPLDDGRATELHFHFRANVKMPRPLVRLITRMIIKTSKVRESYANLARFASEEYRGLQSESHPAETAATPS